MIALLFFLFFGTPLALSIWNLISFVKQCTTRQTRHRDKVIELLALLFGLISLYVYQELQQIRFVSWDTALINGEQHPPISPAALPSFLAILLVSLLAYLIARFEPLMLQPPLRSVLCMAGMYLGAAACVLWCVQTSSDLFLLLLPLNVLLIFAKTILSLIQQRQQDPNPCQTPLRYARLSKLLNRTAHWHWLALLLALPLLGILIAILLLFGQAPDSLIRVWTDTAEWTLSSHQAPPELPYDAHYLCTVAARGHRRLVKPLRTGLRHGHCVLVNRQLCVANAFEQLLSERFPRAHRCIRTFYDRTGYPIAKHIRSPYVADAVYLLMKPLEWGFLAVLYLCDRKPEQRIATQYPHSSLPGVDA